MPQLHIQADHRGIRAVLGVVGAHGLILAVALLVFASAQTPCAPRAVDCRNSGGLFLLVGIIAGLVGTMLVSIAVWAEFRGD